MIAALVVVGAAALITASILERQSMLADALIGERDRAQADWLLRGGLDWSRLILLNDARRNAITSRNSTWAQPIAGLEITTPDGQRKAYFSGQIEDEQGKYNLWRLAERGAIAPQELATLERLLVGLKLPGALAGAMAQRVAAAQPDAQGGQAAPGLRNLSDFLGADGMTPDIASRLAPYLTVLPEATAINVNTASAEVLSAGIPGLDLATARDMASQRDRGQGFNSRGDFFNRLGRADNAASNLLGVSSAWFKVTGQVTLDGAVVTMQALLQRKGGKPPVIRWIGGLA